jgi:16S rRNA (guanine527-N7)-methyltransferase
MGPTFHVNQDLPQDAARIGISLDDLAVQRLTTLDELLRSRAVELGLIAEADARRVYRRHILDCLRVVPLISDDFTLMDLGTGAGLPGLVVSCALPDLAIVLVDSRRRAGAFLELAVERLGLSAQIRIQRAEELDLQVHVCTARAFGPLARSWEAAYPSLRPEGRLIYFAGAGVKDPEGAARSVDRPAQPASIIVDPVVASSPPLVIMSRGG